MLRSFFKLFPLIEENFNTGLLNKTEHMSNVKTSIAMCLIELSDIFYKVFLN